MTIEWHSYGTGRSTGVTAYALLPDGLLVRFEDGAGYLYDRERPGSLHLKQMQLLAAAGRGLSTDISQHVGTYYAGRFTAAELAQLQGSLP